MRPVGGPSSPVSSSSEEAPPPFCSITSRRLQDEFLKERMRRLESRSDASSPPSSSPRNPASPLSSSPRSPASPAASPLSSSLSPPRSPASPAASPLSSSLSSPRNPASPLSSSPAVSPAVSPLRSPCPQAPPPPSPSSPASPGLSLSSPELLLELTGRQTCPLRRVQRRSGLTTVFSGRGRQVSGSSP